MQKLFHIITKASRQLKHKLDKELKEYDITVAQLSVIIQVDLSEESINADVLLKRKPRAIEDFIKDYIEIGGK
jgi:hypothetical protein